MQIVTDSGTDITLNVNYEIKNQDGWAVTDAVSAVSTNPAGVSITISNLWYTDPIQYRISCTCLKIGP